MSPVGPAHHPAGQRERAAEVDGHTGDVAGAQRFPHASRADHFPFDEDRRKDAQLETPLGGGAHQKSPIAFAIIAQGEILSDPQTAHSQLPDQAVEEGVGPDPRQTLIKTLGDDVVDTHVDQESGLGIRRSDVESRPTAAQDDRGVGVEGQDHGRQRLLPSLLHHRSDQGLVPKMQPIERPDGQRTARQAQIVQISDMTHGRSP